MSQRAERRRHRRYEVYAQVSLRHGGQVSTVRAANLSAGGMFVELDAGAMPGVQPGTEVHVRLDLGSDEHGRPLDLDCGAEVVRVDLGGPGRKPGFAVMWTSTSASVAKQIGIILEYLHG